MKKNYQNYHDVKNPNSSNNMPENNYHLNDLSKSMPMMPQNNMIPRSNNNNSIKMQETLNNNINYGTYSANSMDRNMNNIIPIKNENENTLNYSMRNMDSKNLMINSNLNNEKNNEMNSPNTMKDMQSNQNIHNMQNQHYPIRDPNKFHLRNLSHDIISHKNNTYFLNNNGNHFQKEAYRREDFAGHYNPNTFCKKYFLI